MNGTGRGTTDTPSSLVYTSTHYSDVSTRRHPDTGPTDEDLSVRGPGLGTRLQKGGNVA